MLDIGWSELLVIAVVLIVVVGPKDLPPMIRAFGKTMAGLRKMAGDFRTQFDEALKEADMDDVRQTISDVRNLNPTNSLRDAMNPLRQLGNDIKSDLQKAATPAATSAPATSEPVAPLVSVPEPDMKLPDTPPVVPVEAVGPATSAPAVATASEAGETKPKRSRAKKVLAADTVATADVPAPAAPVAAKPKRVAAKKAPASAETVAAAPKKAAVKKPAAPKDGVKAAAAKTAKPKAAKAKKDEA